MAASTPLVPVKGNNDPHFTALRQITGEIAAARGDISGRFQEIGAGLKRVRDEQLFLAAGLKTFRDYLALPDVDIAPAQAERLIQMSEVDEVEALLPLGINKIVEVLRLPVEQRQKLLSGPVEVRGQPKRLPEMSLAEVREVSQEWRRAGKTRCDRCRRWVDRVKEIDGHFYGSDGPDSCYDREMEERRYVTEHPIPGPQLDTVLDSLQSVTPPPAADDEPGPAEPSPMYESVNGFLHLYAQLLFNAGEARPPDEAARAEAEILQRAIRLLKVRLQALKAE